MGTSRFQACVMDGQSDLECMFDGPAAEEFDAYGEGFVSLVSPDES